MIKDEVRYEITWKNDKMNGGGKKILKNGEEVEVYYLNGIESKSKSSKASLGLNLRELTKKFGSNSMAEKTRSNWFNIFSEIDDFMHICLDIVI